MIQDWFVTPYIVKRKTTTTSTATDVAVAVFTGTCLIEPITEKQQLFDEANIGKEFRMFCTSTDNIKVGDAVEADSLTYGIQSVTEYKDLEGGQETHLEAHIIRRS
jgi:hypothetical protein